MISVILLMTTSSAVTGIVVAGSLVAVVIKVLSESNYRPSLSRLSTFTTLFMIPLLIIFAYIMLVWLAKVLMS